MLGFFLSLRIRKWQPYDAVDDRREKNVDLRAHFWHLSIYKYMHKKSNGNELIDFKQGEELSLTLFMEGNSRRQTINTYASCYRMMMTDWMTYCFFFITTQFLKISNRQMTFSLIQSKAGSVNIDWNPNLTYKTNHQVVFSSS